MKKWILSFFICMSFFFNSAFEHAHQLEVTEVDAIIDEENHLLRYEFQILNKSDKPIKSEFDYPGHQKYGIEMVVQPMEALAELMVIEENTNYTKMVPLEKGWMEYFEPGMETPFYVSYQIKDQADVEQVEKHALHAALLILDGVTTVKTVPLKDY